MANDASENLSARQRARNNTSGINVSRVLRGQPPVHESDEAQPNGGRRRGNAPHDNYASPREFFSGPRQPPRQCSGIRRNPDANRDTVGLMLTDEYLMMNNGANPAAAGRPGYPRQGQSTADGQPTARGAQSYGIAARRGQGATRAREAAKAHKASTKNQAKRTPCSYHDGLTNNCIVTAPEKEWRSGVKITHPQSGMDAPYFEDNDPRPPRDPPAVTGKRHVRPPYKDAKMFGQVPPMTEEELAATFQSTLPPCHKTANRANESVDVLNLYCYSPEELSEKPQPHKQLGPRKYVAPDMPPRKPPMIQPINTPAKQEHDVLGTGRWGRPEKEHPRGLGRGLCRPPHDTANLFRGGVAPVESEPPSHHSVSRRESVTSPDGRSQRRDSQRRDSLRPNSQRRDSQRQVQPFHVNLRGGHPKKRPDPVFTDADKPHKIMSKRNAGSPDLLRYYDPNVDPKPAPSPTKRNGQRVNRETRELSPSEVRPTGKGRGEFCANGRDSVVLTYL